MRVVKMRLTRLGALRALDATLSATRWQHRNLLEYALVGITRL
jgi:hypothetical protein